MPLWRRSMLISPAHWILRRDAQRRRAYCSRAAIEDRRLLSQRRHRMTVEKLANECFAARDLQQAGLLNGPWVTVRSWLRWPGIERIRAARYMIILELRHQSVP